MKKILIATSALAFAGSAFAADVSGYVTSAYQKSSADKSLYTESEIYVSGSKTTSNGLTFGATYTMGVDSSRTKGTATTVKVTAGTVTNTAGSGVISATPTAVSSATGTKSQYVNVNAFVSGSFGKVEMGRHKSAAESIGTKSIQAGSTMVSSVNDKTKASVDNGITYTSPVFAGAQIAYTKVPGTKGAKSLAAKYATTVSGLGIAVAYGTFENKGAEKAKTTAQGIKVTKGAFSVSYTTAKTAESKDKFKRIGLGYSANKVTVGYSNTKDGKSKTTSLYAGYDVASGLTVFVENKKVTGKSTPADNKKTTWIGTSISF